MRLVRLRFRTLYLRLNASYLCERDKCGERERERTLGELLKRWTFYLPLYATRTLTITSERIRTIHYIYIDRDELFPVLTSVASLVLAELSLSLSLLSPLPSLSSGHSWMGTGRGNVGSMGLLDSVEPVMRMWNCYKIVDYVSMSISKNQCVHVQYHVFVVQARWF